MGFWRARVVGFLHSSSSSPSKTLHHYRTSRAHIAPILPPPSPSSAAPFRLRRCLPFPVESPFFSCGDRSQRTSSSVCFHQDPEGRQEELQSSSPYSPSGVLADEKQDRLVPVKAYFLSTSVDLKSLKAQNSHSLFLPSSRVTNYVILRFHTVKNAPHVTEVNFENEDNCQYMLVFQYGSAVLFNVSEHEANGYLKIVEKHALGLLPEMTKDDYLVVERPNLKTWMQGGLDYIKLKNLSIDGIRIIGSILGQSIALDYYIQQVDGIAGEFTDINRKLKETGTFSMERKKLSQLLGKANLILEDVIVKLRLLERSDIAWRNANYAQIWEYLRDEYELKQRFGSLDIKLKYVEHNMMFLQDSIQNRKSESLGWIVIYLIAFELLISVYSTFWHSTI